MSKFAYMIKTVNVITIGIRFGKSFRIPDIAGEMVDDLLYKTNSPFNPKIFPKINETPHREKILFNGKTKNSLNILMEDIILTWHVDDFENDFMYLRDKVIPYFTNVFFQKYKIINIRRIGIIFGHKLESLSKLDKVVEEFSEKNIEKPNSVQLNFSKKIPVVEASYKKGVEDYINVIFTVTKDGDDIFADLDYQLYFEPALGDIRDGNAVEFLKNANSFLINDFHSWIGKYDKN